MLLDGTNAGNGNGFKMGGTGIAGAHVLQNSIAFENKDKGIDSNSGPDIQVENCTSFNNGSYNVALYSNSGINTAYKADGIISFKTQTNTMLAWLESVGVTSGALVTIAENAVNENDQQQVRLYGTQVLADVYKDSNFYWYDDGMKSKNFGGGTDATIELTEADGFILAPVSARASVLAPQEVEFFRSIDTLAAITRYADGGINMNGLLQLTPSTLAFFAENDIVAGAVFEEGLSPSLVMAPLGESVPTGDSTHVYLFITLSVMGGAALVGIYIYDRKKRAFAK
jgi:hypothetical protein